MRNGSSRYERRSAVDYSNGVIWAECSKIDVWHALEADARYRERKVRAWIELRAGNAVVIGREVFRRKY